MGAIPLKREFVMRTAHQLAPNVLPYILLTIATLAVALRFRARGMRKLKLGTDDWLCLVALVVAWPYQACNTIAMVNGGAGVPLPIVMKTDPSAIPVLIKVVNASNIILLFVVCVLQVSILFFYLRIFSIKTWFRTAAIALIVVIALYFVSVLVAQFLTCRPLKKFFNPMDPTITGKCFNQKAFCGASGLIHVVIDLAILLLPIPVIWNLQTSRANKALLTGVLLVGLFATICALLKLSCIIKYPFDDDQDITGTIWFSILVASIEVPLGIICTCIPTLAPIGAAIRESKLGSAARHLLSTVRSRGSGSYSEGNPRTTALSAPKDFRRLDESYVVDVEAYNGGYSSHSGDIPLKNLPDNGYYDGNQRQRNNIQVQRSFEVDR